MAPKNLIRYEQIRRRSDQPDVQASDAPFTEGRYFEASCPSALSVNECVVVTGTNGGGRPKVKKANPGDPDSMPAVGIVVEKMSPQVCVVQVSGLIVSLTGLTAGARYYLGADGVPVTPEPAVVFRQLIGVALGASKLLLFPNQSSSADTGGGVIVADTDSSGADIGALVQVETSGDPIPTASTADPSSDQLTPAVGIIIGKPSSTTCVLQLSGVVDLSSMGVNDLAPGKPCFLWYDGRPSTLYPGSYASPSGYAMIQTVGTAVSPTKMVLNPTPFRVRVATTGKPPPPTR